MQLKIGQSGQATFRWSDMSKGVKEVSRLACGYLKKSSRYRGQSFSQSSLMSVLEPRTMIHSMRQEGACEEAVAGADGTLSQGLTNTHQRAYTLLSLAQ